DQLLGPRGTDRYGYADGFRDLSDLTQRKLSKDYVPYDFLPPLVERCRQRILEVELQRGETPTAASAPALQLQSLYGSDTLFRLLEVLSKQQFHRGGVWWRSSGLSRLEVLSHLVRVTYPAAADTPEAFATRVRQAGYPDERLIELAFLAPQWVRHVEQALGWP